MKYQNKHTAWLIATLFIIILGVACGPATPPGEEAVVEEVATDDTHTADPAPSDTSSDATAAEAVAPGPYVLEGAKTTARGLQYLETAVGDGDTPEDGDQISFHFAGTLSDGTDFGDSRTQGQPLTVILGGQQLFEGLEEGLKLMKQGGGATLAIPASLAPGVIPPDQTLIMDIELLEVEAPPAPTAVDAGDFTTTESGLQYYDIIEGSGDTPANGQGVITHFTIWVQEGNHFVASSRTNDQPLTFTIGDNQIVFPGWDEGVSSMKTGGVRQLIIPDDLALGEAGGGAIPPNASLIMEVELLELQVAILQEEVAEADYTTTDSGLKYFDVTEGDGASPETGQTVIVHYTGWLEDGTKFDSSVDRGQPFTFVLGTGGVIAGWDEGVATMKIGGKRQLMVPAALAYGENGSPPVIPAGATLIFDVELIDIQ